MDKTRHVTIGVDGLKSEIPTHETNSTQTATAPTQTEHGHNIMLNKMYELTVQNTRNNNQCVRNDKHGSMILTPIFQPNTDVARSQMAGS
jgi:hypothetical protein